MGLAKVWLRGTCTNKPSAIQVLLNTANKCFSPSTTFPRCFWIRDFSSSFASLKRTTSGGSSLELAASKTPFTNTRRVASSVRNSIEFCQSVLLTPQELKPFFCNGNKGVYFHCSVLRVGQALASQHSAEC